MADVNTITTETAASLLLGRLSDERREAVEELFVTDQAIFNEVLQAENDLIDDYVAGRLGVEDRRRFERFVLPRAKMKVQFARALARYSATAENVVSHKAESWIESLRRFVSGGPAYAFGLAALALLLVSTAYWISRPIVNEVAVGPRTDGVETPEGASTPASPAADGPADVRPPVSENPNVAERPVRAPRTDAKPATRSPVSSVIATISLSPVTRGSGTAASLSLPKRDGLVRLELPADSRDFSLYSVLVETVDGQLIWQRRLPVRPGPIRATVPAKRLSRGDYIVTLKGIPAGGIAETLNEYSFSIR